jgi:hypothetical protein
VLDKTIPHNLTVAQIPKAEVMRATPILVFSLFDI